MSLQYDSAGSKCLGGPQPGLVELKDWVLHVYDQSYNLGIYNCRNVRGGSVKSLHAEGRALDVGWDRWEQYPFGHPQGHALASFLVINAEAFGVQEVIWTRRIWSANNPEWRRYNGKSPHLDHAHIGLNWWGAENLTARMLSDIHDPKVPEEQLEEDVKLWLITAGDGPVYVSDLASFRRHVTADEINRFKFLGILASDDTVPVAKHDIRAIPVVGATYSKTHPDR